MQIKHNMYPQLTYNIIITYPCIYSNIAYQYYQFQVKNTKCYSFI